MRATPARGPLYGTIPLHRLEALSLLHRLHSPPNPRRCPIFAGCHLPLTSVERASTSYARGRHTEKVGRTEAKTLKAAASLVACLTASPVPGTAHWVSLGTLRLRQQQPSRPLPFISIFSKLPVRQYSAALQVPTYLLVPGPSIITTSSRSPFALRSAARQEGPALLPCAEYLP